MVKYLNFSYLLLFGAFLLGLGESHGAIPSPPHKCAVEYFGDDPKGVAIFSVNADSRKIYSGKIGEVIELVTKLRNLNVCDASTAIPVVKNCKIEFNGDDVNARVFMLVTDEKRRLAVGDLLEVTKKANDLCTGPASRVGPIENFMIIPDIQKK